MNRDNFFKIWSLGIKFDPSIEEFPASLEKSFFLIKKDQEDVVRLAMHRGVFLVSIDSFFGIKVDLDINDLEEGNYNWEIQVFIKDELVLFDSGSIDVLGKPTKQKVARPWDLLNPKTEYVEDEIAEKRLDICKSCEMFVKGLCKSCGCYMPIKTKISHASCPLNKWDEHHA